MLQTVGAYVLTLSILSQPCVQTSDDYRACLETKLLEHAEAVDHLQSALNASKQLNEALSKENQELAEKAKSKPYYLIGGISVGLLTAVLIFGFAARNN